MEKGIKARVTSEVTQLHHKAQKPALFNGRQRTYLKKNDDGEDFPAESVRVQEKAEEVVQQAGKLLSELFDVTAAKDYANYAARADVKVDGKTLLEQAPATFLLFLEKQLVDLHTFVSKLPTLDTAEDWTSDVNSGLYRTAPTRTTKTAKVQKALVLYPATHEHPAQTQLVTEDQVIGSWETISFSGALPVPQKKALLERVEKLQRAVKYAREEANSTEAEEKKVGENIIGWLLNG